MTTANGSARVDAATRSQGGSRELVVRQEHQRRIQQRDPLTRSLQRGNPMPEAIRQGELPVLPGALDLLDRRKARKQFREARDEGAAMRGDRGQPQVGSERVCTRQGRSDHREAIRGRGGCRQWRGCGPGDANAQGRSRPHDTVGQRAGPQQFRDRLERGVACERDCIVTAKEETVVVNLRNRGRQRYVDGTHTRRFSPRATMTRQAFDFGGVEAARTPVGRNDPIEHAAADVRVDRFDLDAEALGDLFGREDVARHPR